MSKLQKETKRKKTFQQTSWNSWQQAQERKRPSVSGSPFTKSNLADYRLTKRSWNCKAARIFLIWIWSSRVGNAKIRWLKTIVKVAALTNTPGKEAAIRVGRKLTFSLFVSIFLSNISHWRVSLLKPHRAGISWHRPTHLTTSSCRLKM